MLNLRDQNRVSVEEVQQLQEGEHITLFKGQVIRGSSLYIKDVDKHSRETIRINRFIEVQPADLDEVLAHAPLKIRRSYPRADRVQQILRSVDAAPGRSDLSNLVLTDPLLATLNDVDLEWRHIWSRRPTAAVRSTILWETALSLLPKRSRGYKARSAIAQVLGVSRKRLEGYQAQHVVTTPAPMAPWARDVAEHSSSKPSAPRRPRMISLPDDIDLTGPIDTDALSPPPDRWE